MRARKITAISIALIACFFTAAAISQTTDEEIVVTLIFTNDMESAYEPVPAWWIDDMEWIGGLAQLTSLIHEVRRDEPNVFLFDSGDIFTGALSRLTDGALMWEFMITMGYDAMAIGNHEFDFGEEVLATSKHRVPFPVLGANLFYKDTDIRFAQPHAVLERGGVRIGVVGILGEDAARTAVAPDHIDELDVTDTVEAAKKSIDELRDDVDLIVLLTHQGHTAPMQTDAEIDPRLARDINKDIALAGDVDGIDVLLGGHADAGTWEPVVNPETGTLIMQTFGQGTYLGFLQLTLDAGSREITSYEGKLIPVDADRLPPHPVIDKKNAAYRAAFPEITEVVGRTEQRLNRRYFDESDLGNLIADMMVETSGADIGLMHPGGIRADLPQGDIEIGDILDTNPFVDPVMVMELTGIQLAEVFEQSFTHLRGLMQVSGVETIYDMSRPEGQRLVALTRNAEEISNDDVFEVVLPGIIANGGDHYDMFKDTRFLREYEPLGEMMIAYFRKHGVVSMPTSGRQIDVSTASRD